MVDSIEVGIPKLGLDGPGLVLGSHRSVDLVPRALLPADTIVWPGSKAHNPADIVQEARAVAAHASPRWYLAVGSSSAIDLTKAVAAVVPAPISAIPTTLGGSEMTRIYGERHTDGIKRGGAGRHLLPATVLYDETLLSTLSPQALFATGMNALAHAIEATYARKQHWIASSAGEDATRTLPRLLARDSDHVSDPSYRRALFACAAKAGFATNNRGMGLHHAICHALGGITGFGHAALNAIILPYAVTANTAASPAVKETLSAAGLPDPSQTLHSLLVSSGHPTRLSDIGVTQQQMEDCIPHVLEAPHLKNNPCPISKDLLKDSLDAAYYGTDPHELYQRR